MFLHLDKHVVSRMVVVGYSAAMKPCRSHASMNVLRNERLLVVNVLDATQEGD